MGCCAKETEEEAAASAAAMSADGPLAHASGRCTDVLCLLILVAAWGGMTVLGFAVVGIWKNPRLPSGDPRRLVYGMDYLGDLCGVDGRTSYLKATAAYRLYDVRELPYAYYLPSGAVVCVESCPSADDADRFFCHYETQETLDGYLAAGNVDAYWRAGVAGVYAYECNFLWKTTEFLTHCVFDDVPDYATAVPCAQALDRAYCDGLVGVNASAASAASYCYGLFCPECQLPGACDFACGFCDSSAPTPSPPPVGQADSGDDSELYEEVAADLFKLWKPMLAFGFGVACGLGFVYLALLQIPGLLFVVVWAMLLAVFVVLAGCAAATAHTAKAWQDEDPRLHDADEVKAAKAVAALLFAGAGLYFCALCFLRKRVALAIGVLKEAARALGTMPALVLLPILQAAGLLCFLAVWVAYALYLASSGSIETVYAEYNGLQISYKEFSYSREQHYAALYLLFVWFWTSEFVAALGQLVVAVAVVRWYFSRNKLDAAVVTPPGFFWLVVTVFKRHAGTAAFGALLVALCKTAQAIVQYLKRNAPSEGSRVVKAVLDCVTACLVAVEKCVRFLNKNAYIQTALHGVGFCRAGFRAFALIATHGGRVAAVGLVAAFVLFFGKLFVALGTTAAFYFYVVADRADDLNGVLAPTFLVFCCAFATVDAFNNLYDMAIWTILQSFILDETTFQAEPFASGALQAAIAKSTDAPAGGCCGGPAGDGGPLRAKFDEYDADKSGSIEAPELSKLLSQLTGSEPSNAELKKMMTAVDTDGSGAIGFDEFQTIHKRALDGTLEFKALADAMRSFDKLMDDLSDDDGGDEEDPGG
ncbi:choline transmembrane transporter [Aureococcus anophagefferens]|nr:choline transmembrane transporter [Aureococcus anophagefferens]